MTPIDPEIEKKRKDSEMEQEESRRKKKRKENTIILDNNDLQLITEEIAEAAQTSFKTIAERQTELTVTVVDLLKVLCKVVGMLNL